MPSATDNPLSENYLANSLGILARGSILKFLGIGYNLGARLAFNIIVARLLGPGQVGIYFLTLSVVGVLASVVPGAFEIGLVRYMAGRSSNRDWGRLRGAVRFSLGVVAVLTSLLAVILALGASWIGHTFFGKTEVITPIQIVAVSLPLLGLEAMFLAVPRAFKQVKYKVIIDYILNPTGKIILTILFVQLGWGLTGVFLAYLVNLVAITGIAFMGMRRCLPGLIIRGPEGQIPRRERLDLIKYAYPLFGINILSYLLLYSDLFIVGRFLPVEDIGVYSVCIRLAAWSSFVLPAVGYLFAPIFSEMHHHGQRDGQKKLLQTATLWMVQIYLPILLLFFVGGRALLGMFGQEFVAGASCLMILMAGWTFNVMTGPVGVALNMSGAVGLQFWNALGVLLLQVALALWLIPQWGIVGAATANATSLVASNLVRVIQLRRREGIQPFSFALVKPIGAAALALLIVVAFRSQLETLSAARLAYLYAGIAFAYLGMLVSFGLDDHSRLALQGLRASLVQGTSRAFGSWLGKENV